MRVRELIRQLFNAEPDSVVLFLESHAWVDESDEILEIFVDSNVWTYETGARFGEPYEVRYPGIPRAPDEENHVVTTQSVEHVVVLSNGPTNLRYVSPFKPSKRQQDLIRRPLASHRRAQVFGRYAPSGLFSKWTRENSMTTNTDMFAQRNKRRFLGVSRLNNRGLMTVPLAVRRAAGMPVGVRLCWCLTPGGGVSINVMPSRRRIRGQR